MHSPALDQQKTHPIFLPIRLLQASDGEFAPGPPIGLLTEVIICIQSLCGQVREFLALISLEMFWSETHPMCVSHPELVSAAASVSQRQHVCVSFEVIT